jgi:hypothetical protein
MRFRSILKNRDLFVVSALSLRERVARQAPGEGSPSHDFQKSTDGGAGCPHPALAAPPSPDGRRTRPSFSNLFRTALVTDRPFNRTFVISKIFLRVVQNFSDCRTVGCGKLRGHHFAHARVNVFLRFFQESVE